MPGVEGRGDGGERGGKDDLDQDGREGDGAPGRRGESLLFWEWWNFVLLKLFWDNLLDKRGVPLRCDIASVMVKKNW